MLAAELILSLISGHSSGTMPPGQGVGCRVGSCAVCRDHESVYCRFAGEGPGQLLPFLKNEVFQ